MTARAGENWGAGLDEIIASLEPIARRIRRRLHADPEPSGEERETTEYLRALLSAAGLAVRRGPDGLGLIVDGPDPGPRIALRADLDALRIGDAKTVEYRSRREGVMHGCGHDAHAACAATAALALTEMKRRGSAPWPIPWRAIFQPAEETAEGARAMVAGGALDGAAAILALHVDPSLDVGSAGLRDGPFTAECDWMEIVVEGRGGHAARPHESDDPVAAAAQLVNAIYAFIPRSADARDPVVVTIGQIEGGYSANVIPDAVRLRGTLRTLDGRVSAAAKDRVRRLARGIAEAAGVRIDVVFGESLPGVRNDPALTALLRRAAEETIGVDQTVTIDRPSMGGEDFSGYLERVPGAMFRLGVRSGVQGAEPLHSPRFDIDERALAIGARILARAAVLWSRPSGGENQP